MSAASDATLELYPTSTEGRPPRTAAIPPWYRIDTTNRLAATSATTLDTFGQVSVVVAAIRSATARCSGSSLGASKATKCTGRPVDALRASSDRAVPATNSSSTAWRRKRAGSR